MLPLTHGRRRGVPAAPAQLTDLRVHVRGPVPRTAVEEARGRLRTLLLELPQRVLYTRVKLTVITDPGVTWPAVAQANLGLADRTVRAQVATATPQQAARLLTSRLRFKLDPRPSRPDPGTRRWPAQLNHLTDQHALDGERAVLRRKACWPQRLTPDQAVAQLEDLDYDVHLFVEQATGLDAVVYRAGAGYRLSLARPAQRPPGAATRPLTVSGRYPPTLDVCAAKAQIEAFGLPFLFFLDAPTGRGAVLYHRYDGHLGLITSIG